MLLDDCALRAEVHGAAAAVLVPAAAQWPRDYRAVYCGYAAKQPNEGHGAMPFHQDITFAPSSGRPGTTLWVPLVDVEETNGCLWIVPGSHSFNRGPRAPASPFLAAAWLTDLREPHARPLPMRAGQAMVMDQCCFTPPASTATRSCGRSWQP